MPVQLCVYCPNEGCDFYHEPIRLVFANMERTVDGAASWPEDGTKLYIACPGCRCLTVHSKADLCDFPESDETVVSRGQVWIRITVMCSSQGCDTPAAFHVLLNQASNNQLAAELQNKLATRHWSGILPCGHPIAAIPNGRWYFDRPHHDRLLGYKPRDHTGTFKH
jgi:hypothetical protein